MGFDEWNTSHFIVNGKDDVIRALRQVIYLNRLLITSGYHLKLFFHNSLPDSHIPGQTCIPDLCIEPLSNVIMKRKDFLKKSMLTGAAAALGSSLMGSSEDSTKTSEPTIQTTPMSSRTSLSINTPSLVPLHDVRRSATLPDAPAWVSAGSSSRGSPELPAAALDARTEAGFPAEGIAATLPSPPDLSNLGLLDTQRTVLTYDLPS